MNDALGNIRTRNTVTPQGEQADERQVKNNAGGYTFTVSDEARVVRFLTLGTDGGTYYQSEKDLTKLTAGFIIDFAKSNPGRLAELAAEVSTAGRAPRQNPALFAFALVFAFGDTPAKAYARTVFNDVVRTGTHLFTFVKYAEQFRGWGPSLTKAVAGWYLEKDAKSLSYQLVKYRQREGFTHRDVLRLAHPKTSDAEKAALFDWACGRTGILVADGSATLPYWVRPYELAQALGQSDASGGKVYAELIRANPGMSWEMLPDAALKLPETWEALLDNGLPITALIRQLPRLTNLGLLQGTYGQGVAERLTNSDLLRKGRVHPVKLLYALKTYSQGRSVQGTSTWTPVQKIVDALDTAFYASFKTVEPSGKRTLIAQDVSGSMSWSQTGVLTCAEGATAMGMVTAATEPWCEVMGFANTFRELPVSPRRRLDDNLRTVAGLSFGSTDCALPMVSAKQQKRQIDTFVVYTDNETWAGHIQPHEALRQYREAMGIDARLIVVGMTATEFTIAHPDDPKMLDVAGFDADTPSVISGFSRGDFG